ncbi:hypothetical protein [Mesomycoplasma hyorhinis]|uniref:hypothetical protein n=1 Tax=Mesomycoplasma hyorhinis TaxID=2100 RepID=UPI001C03B550|nr:hypothetical protein [Mesomycoplasma hyorhinis]
MILKFYCTIICAKETSQNSEPKCTYRLRYAKKAHGIYDNFHDIVVAINSLNAPARLWVREDNNFRRVLRFPLNVNKLTTEQRLEFYNDVFSDKKELSNSVELAEEQFQELTEKNKERTLELAKIDSLEKIQELQEDTESIISTTEQEPQEEHDQECEICKFAAQQEEAESAKDYDVEEEEEEEEVLSEECEICRLASSKPVEATLEGEVVEEQTVSEEPVVLKEETVEKIVSNKECLSCKLLDEEVISTDVCQGCANSKNVCDLCESCNGQCNEQQIYVKEPVQEELFEEQATFEQPIELTDLEDDHFETVHLEEEVCLACQHVATCDICKNLEHSEILYRLKNGQVVNLLETELETEELHHTDSPVQEGKEPCGCSLKETEESCDCEACKCQECEENCSCSELTCGCQEATCSCAQEHCGCQEESCACPNTTCACTEEHCECTESTCGYENEPCECEEETCGCVQESCDCSEEHCECVDETQACLDCNTQADTKVCGCTQEQQPTCEECKECDECKQCKACLVQTQECEECKVPTVHDDEEIHCELCELENTEVEDLEPRLFEDFENEQVEYIEIQHIEDQAYNSWCHDEWCREIVEKAQEPEHTLSCDCDFDYSTNPLVEEVHSVQELEEQEDLHVHKLVENEGQAEVSIETETPDRVPFTSVTYPVGGHLDHSKLQEGGCPTCGFGNLFSVSNEQLAAEVQRRNLPMVLDPEAAQSYSSFVVSKVDSEQEYKVSWWTNKNLILWFLVWFLLAAVVVILVLVFVFYARSN